MLEVTFEQAVEYEGGEPDKNPGLTSLLKHNPDLTITNFKGRTPLIHAIQTNNRNAALLLVSVAAKEIAL